MSNAGSVNGGSVNGGSVNGGSVNGSLPPPAQRWFEHYRVGRRFELGSFIVSEEDLLEFASRYDPQPMHVDRSFNGELIASGWQTACLAMRLIALNYLPTTAGLPSPGVESLRWPHPVRPGDRVRVSAEVTSARVSNTRPDRGIVTTTFQGTNQHHLEVLSFEATSFVRRAVRSSDESRPWKLD